MMKKIGILAILIFGLAILGIILFAKDFNVEISESRAQAAIDSKISKGVIRSRGIELVIRSAIIDFKSNDTAAVTVDFSAAGFGYAGDIEGDFATGLRYDAPQIFLENIVPVKMELAFDDKTENKIQDIKNVGSDFLRRQKKKMLSENAKGSLENILSRNETAVKDFAAESTYKFFETLPLYNLNEAGLQSSLVSMALKDVKFTENSAVITLSPVQALLKILTFIGTLLLVITYVFGAQILPLLMRRSDSDS